ncbi:MAG: hypothetical protein SWO11_08025 [Thermodesulfobacteriota bacterium]|nr:hypothetical protein [Thermodesulfobacteriota bacterium]
MFKLKTIGFSLLIIAGVLFLFKGLSGLMEKKLEIFTIQELFGLDWIEKIPLGFAQSWATTISTNQLWIILAILGTIFFLIGAYRE